MCHIPGGRELGRSGGEGASWGHGRPRWWISATSLSHSKRSPISTEMLIGQAFELEEQLALVPWGSKRPAADGLESKGVEASHTHPGFRLGGPSQPCCKSTMEMGTFLQEHVKATSAASHQVSSHWCQLRCAGCRSNKGRFAWTPVPGLCSPVCV